MARSALGSIGAGDLLEVLPTAAAVPATAK